jgi:hypothetical protein
MQIYYIYFAKIFTSQRQLYKSAGLIINDAIARILKFFLCILCSTRACVSSCVMYCKLHSANKLPCQVGSIKRTFI